MGGDNEVQRTMLELINQLDGFDPRGNIKVLMATNRPDTLDPALVRPGRLDRKIEFALPDLEVRLFSSFFILALINVVILGKGSHFQNPRPSNER
jgi:ATP-dependent 26S proteasome regulatory subunit